MPCRTSKTGSELFIVDNSDVDWKVLRYLHDWCQISKAIDIATGYFEIGALLGLKDEWQKVVRGNAVGQGQSQGTQPGFLGVAENNNVLETFGPGQGGAQRDGQDVAQQVGDEPLIPGIGDGGKVVQNVQACIRTHRCFLRWVAWS